MTRTEMAVKIAETLSEIDDLGDMYDEGMLSEDIYLEELAVLQEKLQDLKEQQAYWNSDFSAEMRYD